jgi:rfaE bifunctional protein kinase chain/domain
MAASFSPSEIKKIFQQISTKRVMVVGDCMLDDYWHGDTHRISPEAPVPILQINRKESRPGGAANVALNCASLGAQVQLFTVIGHDAAGTKLLNQLKNAGIDTESCIRSKARITTTKTRLLSKQQQLLRIDDEISTPLNARDEHRFIDTCLRAIQINKPDILIIEDYNKGLLSENTIKHLIKHAQHVGVLTAVDPKKENFFAYTHADIFKPNLKELREAFNANWQPQESASLQAAHQQLKKALQHKISLFTLSEWGMYGHDEKAMIHLPAFKRAIADVSGAGDTVISVFSLAYAVTKQLKTSMLMANLAGGWVCEKPGVIPIERKALEKEMTLLKDLKIK